MLLVPARSFSNAIEFLPVGQSQVEYGLVYESGISGNPSTHVTQGKFVLAAGSPHFGRLKTPSPASYHQAVAQ